MTVNDEYIVEILESVGLITHRQGEEVLRSARQEKKEVIEILVRNTGRSKFDILKALAAHFGMEIITEFNRCDYADNAARSRNVERIGPRTVRKLTSNPLELFPW